MTTKKNKSRGERLQMDAQEREGYEQYIQALEMFIDLRVAYLAETDGPLADACDKLEELRAKIDGIPVSDPAAPTEQPPSEPVEDDTDISEDRSAEDAAAPPTAVSRDRPVDKQEPPAPTRMPADERRMEIIRKVGKAPREIPTAASSKEDEAEEDGDEPHPLLFPDSEDKLRRWFERQRWPDGIGCTYCGAVGEATKLNGKAHRPGLYQCNACRRQYTVTCGTPLHRSRLKLEHWFGIMVGLQRGWSMRRIQKALGIGSYGSLHRAAHIMLDMQKERSPWLLRMLGDGGPLQPLNGRGVSHLGEPDQRTKEYRGSKFPAPSDSAPVTPTTPPDSTPPRATEPNEPPAQPQEGQATVSDQDYPQVVVNSTFRPLETFPDQESAREYLEGRRWGDGLFCPYCNETEMITARKGGYYRCRGCRKDFTVRTGTIFERSHVLLHKWIYALYLFMKGGKEANSLQLAQKIGVTQKTSWLMLRRIRGVFENQRATRDDAFLVPETERRSKRPHPYVTISAKRTRKAHREYFKDNTQTDHYRPKHRHECVDGPRPCPYVGCQYHLYLEITPLIGSIRINFPRLGLDKMPETCALDVAERGEHTLDEVGGYMNISRERVRQLEKLAFEHLTKDKNMRILKQYNDEIAGLGDMLGRNSFNPELLH